MRVVVHVRPNASCTSVGGAFDGALALRVTEPPEGGRATAAALAALAEELGVPRRAVRLVRGASSRRKLVEVETASVDLEAVEARLALLLAGGATETRRANGAWER